MLGEYELRTIGLRGRNQLTRGLCIHIEAVCQFESVHETLMRSPRAVY